MKRFLLGIGLLCVLLSCCACRITNDTLRDTRRFLEHAISGFGYSQLTPEQDLIGWRILDESDHYTGFYQSECEGQTGRDVIFGGASFGDRTLRITGKVSAESGSALLRIGMNEEVLEIPLTEDTFETECNLESGGNYIMICYQDFTGHVEMSSSELPVCQKGWGKRP